MSSEIELALLSPEDELIPKAESSSIPSAAPPVVFSQLKIDNYEVDDGIQFLVVRPEEEDVQITSYAFSEDGTQMAIIYSNNRIQIRSTHNYSIIEADEKWPMTASIKQVFTANGEKAKFRVIDECGVIFRIDVVGDISDEGASTQQATHHRINITEDITLQGTIVKTTSFKNGMLLISKDDPDWRGYWWLLHRIRADGEVRHAKLFSNYQYLSNFVASESGEYVFARTLNSNRIVVWPRIEFNESYNYATELPVDKASLGTEGKYLLVQTDKDDQRTQLTVYQSDELASPEPRSFRSMTMDARPKERNAVFLAQNGDDEVRVLVQEIFESGYQRFSIWNVNQNIITKEFILNSIPTTSFLRDERQSIHSIHHQFEDLSKLKLTSDNAWAATICVEAKSVIAVSLRAGSEACRFSIPEFDRISTKTYRDAFFDPQDRHFIVACKDRIVAMRLPFLRAGFQTTMISVDCDVALKLFQQKKIFCEAFRSHRSNTVAEVLLNSQSNLSSDVCEEFMAEYRQNSQTAVLLRSNSIILFHWYETDKGFVAATCFEIKEQAGNENLARKQRVELPQIANITVKNVFLCESEGDEDVKTVMLCWSDRLVAVFPDLNGALRKKLCLGVSICYTSRLSTDGRVAVLLLNDRIIFLDLQGEEIAQSFNHALNLNELFGRLSELLAQCCVNRNTGVIRRERRPKISDDGQTILLGWDDENRRSIVAHPNTTEKEVLAAVKSLKALSEFCELSRDGRKTCFVDISEFVYGKFVIGVFDETQKRVIIRTEIRMWKEMTAAHVPKTASLEHLNFAFASDGSHVVIILRYDCLKFAKKCSVYQLHLLSSRPYLEDIKHLMGQQKLNREQSLSLGQVFERLFRRKGDGAIFNLVRINLSSLYHEAWMANDTGIVDCIHALALEHGFALTVEWVVNDKMLDVLMCARQSKSETRIRETIKMLCSPPVSFSSAASILKKQYKYILIDRPSLIHNAIKENDFIIDLCKFRVHGAFLDPHRRTDSALHIDASNTVLHWKLHQDGAKLASMWCEKYSELMNTTEMQKEKSTKEATLRVILIEDAAKVGMQGIIRPLLLKAVPAEYFKFDAIKHVVNYKWHKIWKKKVVKMIMIDGVFLAVFSAYVIVISASAHLSHESETRVVVASVLVTVSAAFGFYKLVEEINQLRSFRQDGKDHFKSQTWGLKYYLYSKWNWADLASCLLLCSIIPILHFASIYNDRFDDVLSIAVAIEGLLASFKVWYLAQPFRGSGALVLMIVNIARDCFVFMGLASVVLFGFSLSMHALFRSIHPNDNSQNKTGEINEQDRAGETFGTFQGSLLLLFYAMLGTFEPEDFASGGSLSWMIKLTFSAYMVAQMIVLLNLLIALMGDTFDRVKSTEEAQLLMGRARFIDACEAAMTLHAQRELNNEIGKYVHVLVSADDVDDERGEIHTWRGRINVLSENFRTTTAESERKVLESIKLQKDRVDALDTALSERVTRLESAMQDLNEKSEANFERLFGMIENLKDE